MKKTYIKPNTAVVAIETCAIMAGSGDVTNGVFVRDNGGNQHYDSGTLMGGGDDSEDVDPASKFHSPWDEDWD